MTLGSQASTQFMEPQHPGHGPYLKQSEALFLAFLKGRIWTQRLTQIEGTLCEETQGQDDHLKAKE